jgi:hypothetical protein
MADWKLTLPLTIDEIRALADRLEARGTSVLMRDQPAQCADLAHAAHLLRLLAGSNALPPAGRPLRNDPLYGLLIGVLSTWPRFCRGRPPR